MEPKYDHKKYEEKIYSLWEKSGAFNGAKKGEPYTILMPPPNANASLHAGHAMYTVDDVMARYKRMQGFSVEWIPGTDHAGFETQFVYEKHLAKDGKSRMDFDRETLYKDIFKFVKDNSGLIFEQFKRLGFSADWERSVFTLDKNVIDTAYETFQRMEKEGFVYRDNYIVNFCTHCGTSLAELEVKHIERVDPLYYVRYPLIAKSSKEPKFIVVATTRPEPIFVDTHLAINPKDKKNKWLVGRKLENPITGKEMQIIEDDFVDPEFGTGIVKLTPAHDPNDFEIAKKKGLPIIEAISWNGRVIQSGGKYDGMKVKEAREKVIDELTKKDLIEKIDNNYLHSIITCYKCGRDLEPLTIPNWFIKVDKLKAKVKEVVKEDKVRFYPKKFKKHMLDWLNIMHDWPISRQIVWGIRIPVWYKIDGNEQRIAVNVIDTKGKQYHGPIRQLIEGARPFRGGEIQKLTLKEIKKGLQQVYVPVYEGVKIEHVVSATEPTDGNWIQETNTFDTWFSSSQWPIVTLKEDEFETRFPTDLMGTLSDILKFWVSRMIMFSLYLKQEVPFKDVYLWSMVADSKGVKMSKSKGNVINPLDLVDKYGADALRMSLLYGIPAGSKVILADEKVRGMRNFANKVWNIARYVTGSDLKSVASSKKNADDDWIISELKKTISNVTQSLNKYKLNDATEAIYEFIWHKFADVYIEKTKERRDESQPVLEYVLLESIKLLHPFMPFVTEAIWQENKKLFNSKSLINSSWPK